MALDGWPRRCCVRTCDTRQVSVGERRRFPPEPIRSTWLILEGFKGEQVALVAAAIRSSYSLKRTIPKASNWTSTNRAPALAVIRHQRVAD